MTNGSAPAPPSLAILGSRVLLTVLNPEVLSPKTKGGLWLPETSHDRQRYMQYEVVQAGPDADPELTPGTRAIVRRFAGEVFEQDGQLYRIAWSHDIIGIIED